MQSSGEGLPYCPHHDRRNRGKGGNCPLQYFANQKIKSLKITLYKSVYINKAKLGSLLSGYWKSQIFGLVWFNPL